MAGKTVVTIAMATTFAASGATAQAACTGADGDSRDKVTTYERGKSRKHARTEYSGHDTLYELNSDDYPGRPIEGYVLVYGSQSDMERGYFGLQTNGGYIEVSGDSTGEGPLVQLDGRTNSGSLDGRLTAGPDEKPEICLNGLP